jgi:hypothetical protein
MKTISSPWTYAASCIAAIGAISLTSAYGQDSSAPKPPARIVGDGTPSGSVTSPGAGDAGVAEPTPLLHTGASTFGNETDPAVIDTPPPPARAETKPASPDPKYAWVPGHYIPVKGEWQWVAGKWAQPPTVESVWIQGSYDAKTKRWSEGHWQPDGKPATKVEPNEKGPAPAQK